MAWTNELPDALVQYFQDMIAAGDSDLFLVPGEPPMFRSSGCLSRSQAEPLSANLLSDLAAAVFGEAELARLGTEAASLRKAFCVPAVGANDLQANRRGIITVSLAHKGYLLTGLVIPSVASVEAIGVPETVIAASRSSHGLVIFSGLSGSGKTTLGYSVIDHLNSIDSSHICTISRDCGCDIESKQSFVQHKIVGIDAPDVVLGIKAALEQDVDILLVTELSSSEELDACLSAAMSGHLVFIVCSAASPEEAIASLADMYPPAQQLRVRRTLARYLRCSATLQLFPKADGAGRVAAYGVLLPDDEMRSAICNGKDLLDRQTPLPQGCQTIAEHAAQLKSAGVISV